MCWEDEEILDKFLELSAPLDTAVMFDRLLQEMVILRFLDNRLERVHLLGGELKLGLRVECRTCRGLGVVPSGVQADGSVFLQCARCAGSGSVAKKALEGYNYYKDYLEAAEADETYGGRVRRKEGTS